MTDLGELYRASRERTTALVADNLDRADTPAPATPGWTVHDIIAHLVGAIEDINSGTFPKEGPTAEWTGSHVERGRGVATQDLLDRWQELGRGLEQLLSQTPIFVAVMDVLAHEHDIRGALGNTDARDSEGIRWGTPRLLRTIDPPQPLVVRTEDGDTRVGPEDGEPTTLTTTRYEAFRWRLGRRSRAQLERMDWSGDPAPFLDALCVFGPAEQDVVE